MKGLARRRTALPVAALFSAAILVLISGCGDVFRPVANPIPQTGGPQPATPGYGLVLSNTGPGVQGVVTTINLPGDTNQGQVNVGINPTYAITPDGSRVLATSGTEDTLTVYAPLSSPLGSAAHTISLQSGDAPAFVTSDGATAWTANPGNTTKSPSVGVVNLTAFTETTEVPVGHGPVALTFNSAFSQLYCLNSTDNTVTLISTKDNSVLTTLAVGVKPIAATTAANVGFTFVANQGDGTVSQIDPNALAVIKTFTVGTNPSAIVYDSVVRRVFVANAGSNTVSIIDADPQSITYQAVTTVPVGTSPVALTVLHDGSRVFVTNSGSNDVTVIDAVGNRVLIPSIHVGNKPISIASSPDGLEVIVVNQNDNTVSLIDTVHYPVTGTMTVPATPILVNANP